MQPNFNSGSNKRSRDEAHRQYVAACEASGNGEPPDIDPYLEGFSESERSAVRADLEALRAARKSANGAAGHPTIDFPAPRAETVEHSVTPNPAGGTVDYVPGTAPTGDFDMGARPPRPGLPSTSVAGYEIVGMLGRGAMGVVYQAIQPGLKRTVALKMILSGGHADERELIRFRAEAEAVAKLQHPNIVQVFEIGESNGAPYLSLEFVEGSSLDKKVRGNPLPAREAATICKLLAEAMSYAHQRGIIHRDLKPANVLLTSDGVPKISDFGLAKQLSSEDAGLTRAGTVLGTPSYMAPEQAEGKVNELGPLADVYSLGAILYDLLTGRAPFRGTTLLETLEQVRTREPVPPIQLQPTCPRDLETICLKCLQKDPARRYASAADLAADLERFLKGEPIQARPVSSVERAWRWCKRNPWVAGLSAAVLLVIIAWAATSSGLAWNLKLAKEDSDYQAGVAKKEKLEADKQAGIAKEQKAEAVKQKIKAEEQTGIAQKNEESAKKTAEASVGGMTRMGEKLVQRLHSKRLRGSSDPEVSKLRDEVLAMLRAELRDVSAEIDKAGATPFGASGACQAMGHLLTKIGQADEALQNFDLARRILEFIVQANPKNDQARANLGVTMLDLGNTALDLKGDAREAIEHYKGARALHQEILDAPRDGSYPAAKCNSSLGHDDYNLGVAYLALSDPEMALRHFQASFDRRKALADAAQVAAQQKDATEESRAVSRIARSYLMQVRMSLGTTASYLADDKSVADQFAEATSLWQGLNKERPGSLGYQHDLVELEGYHGDALLRAGKTDEAGKIYQTAMTRLQAVMAKRPDYLGDEATLALMHERLGQVCLKQKREKDAADHFKKALTLRQEMLQIAPNNLPRQAAFILAHARAGQHAAAVSACTNLSPKVGYSTELQLQLARALAVCAAVESPKKSELADQAIKLVQDAVHDRYKNVVALETDADLASVRGLPAFAKILEKVKGQRK